MAEINITREIGLIVLRTEAARETRKTPIRFICIPGIRPVNVPIVHPSNKARIISISILL